jgi:hypothetical protein
MASLSAEKTERIIEDYFFAERELIHDLIWN